MGIKVGAALVGKPEGPKLGLKLGLTLGENDVGHVVGDTEDGLELLGLNDVGTALVGVAVGENV